MEAEFDRRLRVAAARISQPTSIGRYSRSDTVPLSSAQQQLWLLHQLEREATEYNISHALTLRGTLAIECLRDSMASVFSRHETLRTRFEMRQGEPTQVVAPSLEPDLRVIDVRGASEDPRARARKLSQEEAQRPFDLTRAPLLRALLLTIAEEEHILVVTVHHIVCDGWSIPLLFQELAAGYESAVRGKQSTVAEPPFQYRDFVEWERSARQEARADDDLAFWGRYLRDAPQSIALPTDHPREGRKAPRGSVTRFTLPDELVKQCKELARKYESTTFMAFLTVFKILLHRYSQQSDLVVGVPVANRRLPGSERLIGLFVNTVLVRTVVAGDPTFAQLLVTVRDATVDALDHDELPFLNLVKEIGPEREVGRTPLFQVMFAYNNTAAGPVRIPGLEVTAESIDVGGSRFDLTLGMVEGQDGVEAGFEYSEDLFEADTIGRMTGHYMTLMRSALEQPNSRIGELPILTDEEESDLLAPSRSWSALADHDPVHVVFDTRAEASADTAAVCTATGECLSTYGQVASRSNRVARWLGSVGAGPEVVVALWNVSPEEMLALSLGVVKAGAALLPLPTGSDLPTASALAKEVGARALVTRGYGSAAQATSDPPLLDLELLDATVEAQSPLSLQVPVLPSSLAVVLLNPDQASAGAFMIEHRSLVRSLLSLRDQTGLGRGDSVWKRSPFESYLGLVEVLLPSLVHGSLIVSNDGGFGNQSSWLSPDSLEQVPVELWPAAVAGASIDRLPVLVLSRDMESVWTALSGWS